MEHKHVALSILSLAAIISMPMAFADGDITSVELINDVDVIDLADAEKDRVIRAYAQFENFHVDNDGRGAYTIEIQTEGGDFVVDYPVSVVSTVKDGDVAFSSMALYIVTDEALEDENPIEAGKYQMIISTDGSVSEPISFDIVDSRV